MYKSILKVSLLPFLAAWTVAGMAQAAGPNTAQEFVTKAAQAGMMEVEAAKLARAAASDTAVKNFATRMIADHGKANADLTMIAKSKGLTVPAKLDAEHAQMVQQLQGKSGAQFDAAYSMQMAMDHTKAVALFEANTSVPDTDLAAFANKTLPVLREHKRLADQLNSTQKAHKE